MAKKQESIDQVLQREIDHERSRLEFLRERLEVVEALEDDPEGYELEIPGHGVTLTSRAELIGAAQHRIEVTETIISELEANLEQVPSFFRSTTRIQLIPTATDMRAYLRPITRPRTTERQKLLAGA